MAKPPAWKGLENRYTHKILMQLDWNIPQPLSLTHSHTNKQMHASICIHTHMPAVFQNSRVTIHRHVHMIMTCSAHSWILNHKDVMSPSSSSIPTHITLCMRKQTFPFTWVMQQVLAPPHCVHVRQQMFPFIKSWNRYLQPPHCVHVRRRFHQVMQ